LTNTIHLWETTATKPNLLICKSSDINTTIETTKVLNKLPFHQGIIEAENNLGSVQWKGQPGFEAGHCFTIPVLTTERLIFTPKKDGYRFSPDVFFYTNDHFGHEISFKATPLDLTDKQVIHFHFNELDQPSTPTIKHIYSNNNIPLYTDSVRNRVFHFNGQNSYIDMGSSLGINFSEPITIAAWIKPSSTNLNRSILGMGNSFSFKIHQELLTFTTTSIRDHRVSETKINVDEWQHVAVTFTPQEEIKLYINGQLKGKGEASAIRSTDHSIIIGSNIWGEYFDGYIDDLYIWNRALADTEISKLIHPDTTHGSFITHLFLAILIPAGLFVIILFLRRYSFTTAKQNTLTQQPRQRMALLTFGGFHLYDKHGNNIGKELSPRQRTLFLYLLWHTIRNEHRGVSSHRMDTDIWPGMSASNAKNNRSTYLQRLRKHLKQIPGFGIQFSNEKKWQIALPKELYSDLHEYTKHLAACRNKPDEKALINLVQTILRGPFLPETNNEVTDRFKSEIEDEIVSLLTSSSVLKIAHKNKYLASSICSILQMYDPLNETALILEVSWHLKKGNHGRTKETYQKFVKEYKAVFEEEFPMSYASIQKKATGF
jgi:two-component SAPR family response regulator